MTSKIIMTTEMHIKYLVSLSIVMLCILLSLHSFIVLCCTLVINTIHSGQATILNSIHLIILVDLRRGCSGEDDNCFSSVIRYIRRSSSEFKGQ